MAPRKKAQTVEEQLPEIPPCKYRGDPNDEFCKDCNGVTMTVEGVKYLCSECQAYEPQEEEQVEEPVVQEQLPEEEPAEELPPSEEFDVQGIPTTIKAESGVSVELGGRWYKFSYAEERAVLPNCDIEKERQALWADVNRIVDQQVADTEMYLQSK